MVRVDVEAEFDHNDPNFIREPHAVYRRLHENQPVLHSGCYGGFWLLTKYHDVRSALLDWRSFGRCELLAATGEEFGNVLNRVVGADRNRRLGRARVSPAGISRMPRSTLIFILV